MGSRIMFLFRQPRVLNLIQHKRLRTRWVSRQPSKIVSEESDIHDASEVKLNIERQILKKGRWKYGDENQKLGTNDKVLSEESDIHDASEINIERQVLKKGKGKFGDEIQQLGSNDSDKPLGKLPVSKRLRNLTLEDNYSIKNDREFSQSKKQLSDSDIPDPFALSSLMPIEQEDVPSLPDTEPPSTFRNPDVTYGNNRNLEQPFRKISNETLEKTSDKEQNNPRSRPKSNLGNAWPPKLVQSEEGDQRLRRIMVMAKSKKMRAKHNLIVVEGKRLISDFIKAGATPKTLFFSRQQDVDGICVTENHTELYKVTYKQLSLWTDVETSQGVIGIFEMSQVVKQKPNENSLPITVICDNVRDPGNLGSILRIAAGADCEKVLLTKGCVDAWDSKVLRAAAGAHCHLPILANLSWEEVHENLPDGCVTFVADNSFSQNDSTPLVHYNKAEFGSVPHVALVMGGETQGLSSAALSLASARLHVPISPNIDSLNTAAAFAVIVFEARRSLTAGVNSCE